MTPAESVKKIHDLAVTIQDSADDIEDFFKELGVVEPGRYIRDDVNAIRAAAARIRFMFEMLQ